MAYNIKKYPNGALDYFRIDDNSQNTANTSLTLVGKYWVGYGESIAQNSVRLLENFASDTAPDNAIEGQLWWKPVEQQLFIRHNNDWLGIDSDSKTTEVLDTNNVKHKVVVSKVNGVIISITSSDTTPWVINTSETLIEPYFRNNGEVTISDSATILPGINLTTDKNKEAVFHGTATHARYADVAELYASDNEYGPGHVMKIGGTDEVTETSQELDEDAVGVVTTDPALLMNSRLPGITVGIALLGRVPCNVVGKVTKGDRIVTSNTPGHGQSARNVSTYGYQHVIGRAVEDKTTDDTGTVEVIVGVK